MRNVSLAMIVLSLAACAVDPDEDVLSEAEAELEVPVYEPFRLPSGSIDGQNGWYGNCVVFDDAVAPPNKYLRCVGGRNATKPIVLQTGGNFYLQADVWPNANVVNSTHGKLTLEGPQGRVFQIIVGCDNIRVAYQMNGPVAPLLSFPCSSAQPPIRYRVVCTWAGGGNLLRCGAAPLGQDVTQFVDLWLPGPLRPFDRVSVMTFDLPGATLFDTIYLQRD